MNLKEYQAIFIEKGELQCYFVENIIFRIIILNKNYRRYFKILIPIHYISMVLAINAAYLWLVNKSLN